MEYQNAIYLTISIERKCAVVNALCSVLISLFVDRSNWQDWGGRWARRNAFMRHLKIILEELDLRYTLPIQPVLLPSGNGAPTLGHARETNA
jgi:hypothetical protein